VKILPFLGRIQLFLYPVIVHLSIILNTPHFAVCLLPFVYYYYFRPFKRPVSTAPLWHWIKIAIFIALILLVIISIRLENHYLLYLPPILITFWILLPFIISVQAEYTPLITQFYLLTDGADKPDKQIVQYTRILTWVWIGLISLMLVEIILLVFFAPVEIWSLFTNIINYLLLLAFFILEWLFRSYYFNQWVSPKIFIRQLIMVDHQKLLRKTS
jgi:uncharacterized membrane protein